MNKRIGIVGGGQLARMMVEPAHKLGFSVIVIDPTPNSPAGQIADQQIVANFKDEKAIRKLGEISDFLTFEIELANSSILKELEKKGVRVNPSPHTLEIIRDKLKQKKFLKKNKIPVADFMEINSKKDIQNAAKKFGYPILLKARFDAYDGRGNAFIKNEVKIDAGLQKLHGRKLYVERFVPFVKELAVIAVRGKNGTIDAYPAVETYHENNILNYLITPAPVDDEVLEKAKKLAVRTMEHLKGEGVFGIEIFLTPENEVLINEIAPRVHNSGHHTIEANTTSQFENHIRAITGMPLGTTGMTVPAAVMINILGDRNGKAKPKGIKEAEKIPGVKVHIYGKLETKPERKMGHITAVGKTQKEAYNKAIRARNLATI